MYCDEICLYKLECEKKFFFLVRIAQTASCVEEKGNGNGNRSRDRNASQTTLRPTHITVVGEGQRGHRVNAGEE